MTRTRKARRDYFSELFNEHISMPGYPQLIVTRGQAWQFLKELGYPEVGGFGSIDYMVCGLHRKALDLPLTDDATRERAFAFMKQVELGDEAREFSGVIFAPKGR